MRPSITSTSPWRNWLARLTVNQEVGSSSLPGDSPWRNWLARLTVNQEVGSSSLPGDVLFNIFTLFTMLECMGITSLGVDTWYNAHIHMVAFHHQSDNVNANEHCPL
ncbi:hypothetical protein N7475_000929 [Penicillium sp. IBT 31633x]|nr:hypothetical protein N7475_000929 [Penicillium sp. IBT 31633x]